MFDGSAETVISISSYIETVGLFFNRLLSKGLYRPSDNDDVLTCVDSLFICGLCWNPPRNQLNFGKFLVPSEAGSDPRGHLGVTWGVYLCAGKPPLADIILSHPPDLT